MRCKGRERIVFIGPVAPPQWGPAVRNRVIIETLTKDGFLFDVSNTLLWKKQPVLFAARLIRSLWRTPQVFLSVSRNGRFVLLLLLGMVGMIQTLQIVLFPAGGLFARELAVLPGPIRQLYLIFLRQCRLVVVQTSGLATELENYGLHNVLHLPNFKPAPANFQLENFVRSAPDANRPVKLVYLSRIKAEKGVETLLRALDTVENGQHRVSLDLYGLLTEDYRDRFFDLLKKRPWANYRGHLEIDAVVPVLFGYDIMVFPSEWKDEGFPGVLVDAALAGLPVVATRIAFNDEIIEDGVNGLMAEPANPDDLAARIVELVDDKEKRRKLANNNKAASYAYRADTVMTVLLEHLQYPKPGKR